MMNRSRSEPPERVRETVIKKEWDDDDNKSGVTFLTQNGMFQDFHRCFSEVPLSMLKKRSNQANNIKKKSKSSTQKKAIPHQTLSNSPLRKGIRSYSLPASIEEALFKRNKSSATSSFTAQKSNPSKQSSSSISTSPARSRTMSNQPFVRGSTPSLRYAGPSDSLMRAAENQTPPQLPSLSGSPNTRIVSPNMIPNPEKVQVTKRPEIEMIVEWFLRDNPARGRFKDHLILPGRGTELSLMNRTEEQFNRFKIALRKTLSK